MHDNVATSPALEATFTHVTRQTKPWGHELLFADGRGGYVGKLLHVRAGHSLSLQFHERKDETISTLSGAVILEHGPSVDRLTTTTLKSGDAVHLPPGTVHRLTATTDSLLVEASTAGSGWRDDVVRLDDLYGRSGTSTP
jgi:mannose-6-phosphate isomerase